MVDLRKLNKYGFGKSLMPEKIYKFPYSEELENLYRKIHLENLNYKIVANIFMLSILFFLILFFYIYKYIYAIFNDLFYSAVSKFLIIFGTFFIGILFSYYLFLFFYFFYLESQINTRQKKIEQDFPDFLDNLISNLKGGIPFEKALLKSVMPEQKELLLEMRVINQKLFLGKSLIDSLREFRRKYKSQIINRTIFLIEEGLKNGGNIAEALEKISENLKRVYNFNSEIKANSGGFTTIIKLITIFVAPLLFALALTLLTFIGNLFNMIQKSSSQVFLNVKIPTEFSYDLLVFSYCMIFLITLFSSLITAELKDERIFESIKYLPLYILAAMMMFRFASNMLLSFFSNIV